MVRNNTEKYNISQYFSFFIYYFFLLKKKSDIFILNKKIKGEKEYDRNFRNNFIRVGKSI